MRIAHVLSRLDPSDGGPPAVVSRLAAAQIRAGHDVTISAAEPHDEPGAFERAYSRIEGYSDIRLDFWPASSVADRVLGAEAHRRLSTTLADADIVHVHGMWLPPLLHAASIARERRVPYCVTPHGMLSRWTMRQKSFKKRLALALGWRGALNHASFVQYLNPGEREQVRDLGLVERRRAR
jgi:glycosyltransferase involved in cell wall biosynthesis